VDRGLMAVLLQPIKEDLHLSDTQLGLVTGIAFGLFYAVLGLPIARWADRGNRVIIASLAIGLWGATMVSCLFIGSYLQLVLFRIAAAVGEAGCKPPTYSLLGDYFPEPARRTRAMSVYWLANPLAALISFVIGGVLNELHGWRMAFVIMGLPALLVALQVSMTIREPRSHAPRAELRPLPRMSKVLSVLWRHRSSRHLTLALILLATQTYGLGPWYAAFLIRTHGLSTAELGVWLGLIFSMGGIFGTLAGGYIAARWFGNDEARQLRLSAIGIAATVPFFMLFVLLPHVEHALVALLILVVMGSLFFGPVFALLQRLVTDDMRATTLAVVMLLYNLIGMGVGPQVVGVFSDLLAPAAGSDSLRYAMLSMSLVGLWAAFHFWRVGRTVQADLAAVGHPAA
jgi:MFS family permease